MPKETKKVSVKKDAKPSKSLKAKAPAPAPVKSTPANPTTGKDKKVKADKKSVCKVFISCVALIYFYYYHSYHRKKSRKLPHLLLPQPRAVMRILRNLPTMTSQLPNHK